MKAESSMNNGQLVDQNGHLQTEFQSARKALVVTSAPTSTTSLVERRGQRTKMHNPSDLIELARVVQSADSHMKAVVGGKLELITDQIMALQAQARQVLEGAKVDLELSHAKCNFQRKCGNTYHLYRKTVEDGSSETFFSMLSPLEWCGTPPDEYLNSYRLEYDMSWTQVDRIQERDAKRKINPMLLGLTESHVQTTQAQLSLTMV